MEQMYNIYNEAGKFLASMPITSFNIFFRTHKEAEARVLRENPCQLHFVRGPWEGRTLTIKHANVPQTIERAG